jgi:tRNA nucleotidyltransferase (CCA-adding enzyme)
VEVPEKVISICRRLSRSGYQGWLVGGAVRDSILGREPHDWDVATNARPEQVAKLFHSVETGLKHGTLTVLVDGDSYEVTTFRGEGVYSDGRRPDEIQFLDRIDQDLARRDFTMNAIAYDPIGNAFCDPFNGQSDIKGRTIRAVGNPVERFSEDGLRSLRALRFMVTLGFEVDSETYAAIPRTLDTYLKVSAERVRDEWFKIMTAHLPSDAFRAMAYTGMLNITVPEMIPMINCTQNRYHGFDVWEHSLATLDACPEEDLVLRWGALFHDIGKPKSKGVHPEHGDATFYDHENIGATMATEILPRMKLSNEDQERVVHLVRHHFIRYNSEWSSATIRRWVRRVGLDNVASLCTLARADIFGKGPARVQLEEDLINELEAKITKMRVTEVMPTSTKVLTVNGHDVMTHLGIGPGPTIGKVLTALLELVTDNPEVNTRENLLTLAETIVTSS